VSGPLPDDAAARKLIPLCAGVLDYFPSALVEVAKLSQRGNTQHNAGQPLHWARDKSNDHLDALMRHLLERDLVGVAWRALAALQLHCEAQGAPVARNARLPPSEPVIVSPEMAALMLRDGVIRPDDDQGTHPAEPPRAGEIGN